MTTQKQVALELIGKHVAEYKALDVHGRYGERLTKAEALVACGNVHHQDGVYLVQGTRPEPYVVNGNCQCEDFTREQCYKGWCKHRLAAKLYQVVLADLEAMRRAGTPHLHYVCEHAALHELCWGRECPEPMNQLCATCAGNLDGVSQNGMSPLELAELAQSWEEEAPVSLPTEAWNAEVRDAGPPLNGNGPMPTGISNTMTAEELAVVAAPVYEPNTSAEYVCQAPGKGKKPAPTKVGMPEAPASLNLKIKLPGGNELMYTARSMQQPGVVGDAELESRLPGIMAMLETVIRVEPADTAWPASWFHRLAGWCRMTTNDRY